MRKKRGSYATFYGVSACLVLVFLIFGGFMTLFIGFKGHIPTIVENEKASFDYFVETEVEYNEKLYYVDSSQNSINMTTDKSLIDVIKVEPANEILDLHQSAYSSFAELAENYELGINIWKKYPILPDILILSNKALNDCSLKRVRHKGIEEVTFVSIYLEKDWTFLKKSLAYFRKNYWGVVFVSATVIPNNKANDICYLHSSRSVAIAALLACNHTITEQHSTFGTFLSQYNSGDVAYADNGSVKNEVPILDDRLLDILSEEPATEPVSQDQLVYKLLLKHLSFFKGRYVKKASTKSFQCCPNTPSTRAFYGSKRCAKPENFCYNTLCTKKNKICGLFGDKQVYCDSGGRMCNCATPKENKLQYVWSNRKGQEVKFDSHRFCKALGNRTLLMIGDSTTGQSFEVLTNEIIGDKAACANQLKRMGSDYLTPTPLADETERFKSLEISVNYMLEKTKGREVIIILNAGHHVNRFTSFVRILKDLRVYIESNKKLLLDNQIRFFWKSQSPAHVDCYSMLEPLKPRSTLVYELKGHSKWGFWNVSVAYDLLALGYLKSVDLFDGFLDVSPMYLRGDSHSNDCSHYCMDKNQGSALDILNPILLEALETDKASKKWKFQGFNP